MIGNKMLFPATFTSNDISRVIGIKGYHQFNNIVFPKKTYFHLHSHWNSEHDLPDDYDLYIVSWHLEYIDFDWITRQSRSKKIIVMSDFNDYQYPWPQNVFYVRWIYWHIAIDQMIDLFGVQHNKDIKYKASAFCNRITQSKLIITTALLEYLEPTETLISLSDWLEEKNVHFFQKTGRRDIDNLVDIFRSKYEGTSRKIDDFTNDFNFQHHTSNPYTIAYQQAALHFTNESFHYSFMQLPNTKGCIIPGPHLSEKTFKCLLGGTAFISVGQFDVYRTLADLGLMFDYGMDLSFDQEPGNLTRLSMIIDLIKELKNKDIFELYQSTVVSNEHNRQQILNGNFFKICEDHNSHSLEKIKALF